MPMVRAAVPGAAGRLPAALLPCQVQNDVLVSPAPLGRARGSGRLPDHRCRQERRSRSVHLRGGVMSPSPVPEDRPGSI